MAWTECSEPRPFAAQRLVCFPHAGGSSYFFRNWRKGLPETEVHAVCYPGRAHRFEEPPATDLVDMAGEIAASLRPLMDRPTALFGHSMGAVVAYETARILEAGGDRLVHLFVSGARPAHLVRQEARAAALDDESVIATLMELGGTDAELLDSQMFRSLVLPYVKADFHMLGAYVHRPGPPLHCPITALVGDADGRVTPEQAEGWGEHTDGGFRKQVVSGDHFYLAESPPYALVGERLAAVRDSTRLG
ncbi:alpha/beta fold hydrolase [Streptomyces sp. NPDC051130]|uniref:thioesterase II family protein n=1 Tax=Streptomyces sp. NPDC051130 TaxID=3157223 RepID=UPI00342566B9